LTLVVGVADKLIVKLPSTGITFTTAIAVELQDTAITKLVE